jgi:hypothetical protein
MKEFGIVRMIVFGYVHHVQDTVKETQAVESA